MLKFYRNAQFYMKSEVRLVYFVHDCFCKQFFVHHLPQAPLNLNLLTILLQL